jgi:serine protease DegQ
MPSALRVLPIQLSLTIYEALATEASEISPWLGFAVLELSRDVRRRVTKAPRTGVFIDDVFDPSPASRAGIRAGDVLTSIDGNRLLSVADFQRWLYLSGVGTTVTLEIHRDGRRIEKRVPIEQRPAHLVP